jgi:hypothetical protein
MTKRIAWKKGLDVALSRAKSENMHILLDVFNPG